MYEHVIQHNASVQLDLSPIRRQLLGQVACLYYDGCIETDYCHNWNAPLRDLLGYLCRGDLLRFLVEAGQINKIAPGADNHRIAHLAKHKLRSMTDLLAEPLANYLGLVSGKICIAQLTHLFDMAESAVYRESWQDKLQQLYLKLAHCQDQYDANIGPVQTESPKSAHQLPMLKLAQLAKPETVLHLAQSFEETRKYFVLFYEQDKCELLSLQLHQLAQCREKPVLQATAMPGGTPEPEVASPHIKPGPFKSRLLRGRHVLFAKRPISLSKQETEQEQASNDQCEKGLSDESESKTIFAMIKAFFLLFLSIKLTGADAKEKQATTTCAPGA